MAQYDPLRFRYNLTHKGHHNYYTYDDELYAGVFPEDWVTDCIDGTGPKDCRLCRWYGSWNGVFLGYCLHCAVKYRGTRGRGFVQQGEELSVSDWNKKTDYISSESVYDTYMKGVNLDDIGDIDFYNSSYERMIDELNNHAEELARKESDSYDEIKCGFDCGNSTWGSDICNSGYNSY
jgi:hypothetical protein